jgi:hypothetical protein
MPNSASHATPSCPVVDEPIDTVLAAAPDLALARCALLATSRAYLLGPVSVAQPLTTAPVVRGPSSAVIRKERQRQRANGHRMASW